MYFYHNKKIEKKNACDVERWVEKRKVEKRKEKSWTVLPAVNILVCSLSLFFCVHI